MDARNPRADERPLVPTVAVKNRLLAPFAMLVHQYGIPQYGEVDPTPLFALTFLLMFGAMFGDLGQGAVIAGAAWYYRDKLGRFAPFGILAGGSSMVFGLLYGSVFGFEHVLPALWMSPLHDPILMLKLALGWGVIFLTIACLLAIYNRLVIGNYCRRPARPSRGGQPGLLSGPDLGRGEPGDRRSLRRLAHDPGDPGPGDPGGALLARAGRPCG